MVPIHVSQLCWSWLGIVAFGRTLQKMMSFLLLCLTPEWHKTGKYVWFNFKPTDSYWWCVDALILVLLVVLWNKGWMWWNPITIRGKDGSSSQGGSCCGWSLRSQLLHQKQSVPSYAFSMFSFWGHFIWVWILDNPPIFFPYLFYSTITIYLYNHLWCPIWM